MNPPLIETATPDELAPWRPTRHKIGKPYVTEYLKHYPMSEPAKDFDDRNALYCIVKEEMRALVDKVVG
ncbi:uncharacterized protein J4E79_003973 [Alternaria viburni]|uniref:uncharacterized protein n=1 Tax=Alternaria viburni TaxID=566460 RepID=UPI0020C38E23|nr:uncharacterized protein J4E79_003973 [Alternaria viburni]KAI4662664.1 hypothetical protein J4E79_003973 [Alternaria viburni]